MFISSFALIYFTDTVGVSAASVGILIMVSKFFDGFTDVLMGGLIDRTKSKMGKARPWLFLSAFPLAIALVLTFMVPSGFSTSGKNVYIFVIYTLLCAVFYTASNISYNSLISLAADDQRDRVSMGSIRFIFAVVGTMVVTGGTMVLVNALGGDQRGWTIVAVAYAAIFLIFTLITVFGVREKEAPKNGEIPETGKSAGSVSFGKSLLYLCKNKYFIIMLFLFIINYISSGIGGAVGVYYVNYVWGDPALMALTGIAGVIPMIVVLPVTPKLTTRFGMRKTCFATSLIAVAGSVVLLFSGDRLPLVIAGMVIRSIGIAPFTGAMYALIAEIAEYAVLKFKVHIEGTIYSCSSVGIKVGSGLGIAITGWILTAGGYDGATQVQSGSALTAIRGLFLVPPLVTAALISFLLALLRVEKANELLRSEAE
jgi:GPH family glycoside/pentoside/hexuronide:cation symporter